MSVQAVDPVDLSSVDQHLGPQFDIFLREKHLTLLEEGTDQPLVFKCPVLISSFLSSPFRINTPLNWLIQMQ